MFPPGLCGEQLWSCSWCSTGIGRVPAWVTFVSDAPVSDFILCIQSCRREGRTWCFHLVGVWRRGSKPIRMPTSTLRCGSYWYREGTGAAKAICLKVDFEIALPLWLCWTQKKVSDEKNKSREEKMEKWVWCCRRRKAQDNIDSGEMEGSHTKEVPAFLVWFFYFPSRLRIILMQEKWPEGCILWSLDFTTAAWTGGQRGWSEEDFLRVSVMIQMCVWTWEWSR